MSDPRGNPLSERYPGDWIEVGASRSAVADMILDVRADAAKGWWAYWVTIPITVVLLMLCLFVHDAYNRIGALENRARYERDSVAVVPVVAGHP